jgi:hypothetical protein
LWREKGSQEFVLTKKQRVQLWEDEKTSYCWAYDRDDVDFGMFLVELRKAFEHDGFHVEFACLMGPDYVSVHTTLNDLPWELKLTVVSDVCRETDFAHWGPDGFVELDPVLNFSEWRRTMADTDYLASLVDHSMSSKSFTLEDRVARFEELCRQSEANFVSRHVENAERTILYVPRKKKCGEFSATKVRELICLYAGNRRKLVKHLGEIVLNIDKLLDFVALGRDSGSLSSRTGDDLYIQTPVVPLLSS